MKCPLNMWLASATLAFGMIIFSSCGGGNESDVRRQARESLGVEDNSTPENSPAANIQATPNADQAQTTPPATVNTSGVDHYVCPNDCEGSGGSTQVECPVCGTMYVHNQAYHNQIPSTNNATEITQTVQPEAEPAQNAAGVWHYTCPNGCEGGGGSATACAGCGTTLAHNAAYHN